MLIYTRKDAGNEMDETAPSEDVLELVNLLNKRFENKCEQFSEKKKAAEEFIDARRAQVKNIIETWNIDQADADSLVVSGQALTSWLDTHAMKEAARQYKSMVPSESMDCEKPETPQDGQDQEDNGVEEVKPNGKVNGKARVNGDETNQQPCMQLEDIVCLHGKLDPQRSEAMKRISMVGHLWHLGSRGTKNVGRMQPRGSSRRRTANSSSGSQQMMSASIVFRTVSRVSLLGYPPY